jgi:hypothetical protein
MNSQKSRLIKANKGKKGTDKPSIHQSTWHTGSTQVKASKAKIFKLFRFLLSAFPISALAFTPRSVARRASDECSAYHDQDQEYCL